MCDECVCEDCVYHGQGHNCCRVDANATNVPNNVDDVGFLREVGQPLLRFIPHLTDNPLSLTSLT